MARQRKNLADIGEAASALPSWDHMAAVKEFFWHPHECVVQFHPPEDIYVNKAGFMLHLWRHQKLAFPVPDPRLV
jgi:hypothetical protein